MTVNFFSRVFIFVAVTIIITIGLLPPRSNAAHIHPEKHYQQQWCTAHGGVMEYRLEDGTRVDCLTDGYAVEVDFATKWAEGAGQALYYGLLTGKAPAVLLILEKETDTRYLDRLTPVSEQHGITVWTIRP